MDPNPLSNRQPPHDEVIRRFLQRIKNDSQPTHELPKQELPKDEPARGWRTSDDWRRPSEQLVSPKAAEELARWFRK